MNISELQQQLFLAIKSNIPEHLSATEEIAKVLEVSVDSVYRRLRGEKTISLEELYKLSLHYNISLDQLMNIRSSGFSFQGNIIDSTTFRFEDYIQNMLQTMMYFNGFKQKEIYGLYKDMPIFHHFHFREIAAFKRFVWLKTYLQFPEFKNRKFSFEDYPEELLDKEQKILELYNKMTSFEIWNVETMNIIFRQIDYYRDSQVFESNDDTYRLYDVIEKLMDHLEEQAAAGFKFKYGDPERKPLGEYHMYFNEVLLGNNDNLVILDGVKMAVITHTTINYMSTRDLAFTENMYKHIQNFMKNSTLISSVSEKERSRFFRRIKERISNRKASLKG